MQRVSILLFFLLLSVVLFPCFAQNDWENHHLLHINREPARASFIPYAEEKNDRMFSLDGEWKFNWVPTPEKRPVDFYRNDFDDSGWIEFPVPANWEVNGFGTPIYVSAGYPFKIDPPYVTKEPRDLHILCRKESSGFLSPLIHSSAGWEKQQVFLHFEGVQSAFYVWINGERVGYSQGSMEPSEFRITPYLKSGETGSPWKYINIPMGVISKTRTCGVSAVSIVPFTSMPLKISVSGILE